MCLHSSPTIVLQRLRNKFSIYSIPRPSAYYGSETFSHEGFTLVNNETRTSDRCSQSSYWWKISAIGGEGHTCSNLANLRLKIEFTVVVPLNRSTPFHKSHSVDYNTRIPNEITLSATAHHHLLENRQDTDAAWTDRSASHTLRCYRQPTAEKLPSLTSQVKIKRSCKLRLRLALHFTRRTNCTAYLCSSSPIKEKSQHKNGTDITVVSNTLCSDQNKECQIPSPKQHENTASDDSSVEDNMMHSQEAEAQEQGSTWHREKLHSRYSHALTQGTLMSVIRWTRGHRVPLRSINTPRWTRRIQHRKGSNRSLRSRQASEEDVASPSLSTSRKTLKVSGA